MAIYQIDEANRILGQTRAISRDFEFVEKVLHAKHVFPQESRECLRETIGEMATKEKFCTALFYSEPHVFLTDIMERKLFLVDTHPVNQDLGGNGNGLVKLYHNCLTKACEALCRRLWKRLRTGGGLTKEAGYSFLVMFPEKRGKY